jgi:arginine decarboxylase
LVPSKFFLTKGVGTAKEYLASFEAALRDSGIHRQNLVTVSSILPPRCKQLSRDEGIALLKPGEIIFCVLARNSTNEAHRLISASVGVAIPAERNQYGYLSEAHLEGRTDEETGDYSEDLAAQMLATIMGIQFDVNTSWDEREQVFKSSGKIIRTTNVTQSAIGTKGLWTTVIAAAVFLE